MSELSPETEELLARGRTGTPLSRTHRDELKGAVLAKIATGAILTSTTSAAAWTVTTKAIGVAVIAAVVGVGTVSVVKYETHAHAAHVTATPSGAIAAPTIQASSAPSVTSGTSMIATTALETPQTLPTVGRESASEIASQNTAPAPPPLPTASTNSLNSGSIARSTGTMGEGAATTTPPRASTLEEETRLLLAAHQALVSGDPATALRLLDDHANRFPSSALEPERSADRVFALCAERNVSEARAAGSRFLSAHPSGPLSSRVRASCGGSGSQN